MKTNGKAGKSRPTGRSTCKKSRLRTQKPRLTLKRLSRDFSWRLLKCLFECCCCELGASERQELYTVIRSRDIAAYRSLSARWILQCRTLQKDDFDSAPYGVALKYLLAQFLIKNVDVTDVPRRQRRKQCLEQVIALDSTLHARILDDIGDPVFRRTKVEILRILGARPNLDTILENCRHGPGSTSTIPYSHRSAYFKYAKWPYECGRGAEALFKRCVTEDERWLGSLEQDYRNRYQVKSWELLDRSVFLTNIVRPDDCNLITTVPKDGMKDRPIAKEPTANMYLQLGIGATMKDLLLRAGLNLRDQGRNRELARLASRYPDSALMPATLDLSNASDTVSRDLVEALLPSSWFRLLDSVRSPWGLLPDGTAWRYAKMSSMGNATTFELESLVFYSLLKAVIHVYGDPSDLAYTSVFGDDLVFPRYLAPIVNRYLEWFGFCVNSHKSFSSGGFYESCGSDWLFGTDIRPVYLKSDPANVPELFSVRNRLNRWFARHFGTNMPCYLDTFFRRCLSGEIDRFVGPESDYEFDTYWHALISKPKGLSFEAYSARQTCAQEGDVWFRKLMHNLRVCTSDGGSRFDITGQAGWRVGPRVLSEPTFYVDADGLPQDHCRPEYAEAFGLGYSAVRP